MSGKLAGFWSYAHDDNRQTRGRILDLAEHLKDEYSLLTGNDLELFIDRDSVEWGDAWRSRIHDALDEATFFISIITPRYFTRQECRNEFLRFSGHAKSIGAPELVLPILYVEVDGLREDSEDEVVAAVAKTQYYPGLRLRFAGPNTEEYAADINQMARRLVRAAAEFSTSPTKLAEVTIPGSGIEDADDPDDEDDGLGFIDAIAQFEEALPQWQATIEAFPVAMGEISAASVAATERMERGDAEGKGFAYKVVVARELAEELEPPANRMLELGETYARQVVEIDPGVRAFIARSTEPDLDGNDAKTLATLVQSIRDLVTKSREAGTAFRTFQRTLAETRKRSRDLRPVLTKVDRSLQKVLDAQAVLDEWMRLADEGGPKSP